MASSDRSKSSTKVLVTAHGPVVLVEINRPEVRNAVDNETASALADTFCAFDSNPQFKVAVFAGQGRCFCAGADLREMAGGQRRQRWKESFDGPMGPTRLGLSKPVISAIEGHAVAGGLELALWCDLRIAARDAVFGVFNRRWGVPLLDGGTVRLPRLVGTEEFQFGFTTQGVESGAAHFVRGAGRHGMPTSAAEPLPARDRETENDGR